MNYKKTFNFLKSLPIKLNSFYKNKSNSQKTFGSLHNFLNS